MLNDCDLRVDSRLLFLISQPRSGSTLLQRILATHPEISTTGEPWLSTGSPGSYDPNNITYKALLSFLKAIHPNDDPVEMYLKGIKLSLHFFYQNALSKYGGTYFLDKTPRYYHILPLIYRLFPKAHFIFLVRHPVAVLNSILETFCRNDVFMLSDSGIHHDLFSAPFLVENGIELVGASGIVVRYEKLVRDPKTEVQRICTFLGVDFYPEMLSYRNDSLPRWRLGDPDLVYKLPGVDPSRSERWKQNLSKPYFWRLAYDYVKALGSAYFESMGYEYDQTIVELERKSPNRFLCSLTIPLRFCSTPRNRWSWKRRLVYRLLRARPFNWLYEACQLLPETGGEEK